MEKGPEKANSMGNLTTIKLPKGGISDSRHLFSVKAQLNSPTKYLLLAEIFSGDIR
jgi:hypothetical protein